MKLLMRDIDAAYQKLSEEDRENIDKQARLLEMKMKEIRASHGGVMKAYFGKVQALELLARLGMWMNEEGA
jgi:hypothetical protein